MRHGLHGRIAERTKRFGEDARFLSIAIVEPRAPIVGNWYWRCCFKGRKSHPLPLLVHLGKFPVVFGLRSSAVFRRSIKEFPKSVKIEKQVSLHRYARHADNIEDAHDTKLQI